MEKMNIPFSINTEDFKKRIIAYAEKIQEEELQKHVGSFFAKQGYGVREGIGRTQIREEVEGILEKLWDNGTYTKQLEERTKKYFEEYVQTSIEDAAQHKARKLAFHHVNQLLQESEGNYNGKA